MTNANESAYEFIMETAKTDPVEGAYMLCSGLMRGDRASLKMGYGIGSALIATIKQIPLTVNQIGVVVERLAIPRPGLVDRGPTDSTIETPLVVACLDGGLIQWEYTIPGVGVPEFISLDFDRGDEPDESSRSFVEYATEVADRLEARGADPVDIRDGVKSIEHWLDA